MPAPPKPGRPKSQCGRCKHSSQWHTQTENSIRAGYTSYDGAACHFPGCTCRNYFREPILPVRP